MYIRMYVRTHACTYAHTYVRMHVCMYACMHVCMYLYMYVCLFLIVNVKVFNSTWNVNLIYFPREMWKGVFFLCESWSGTPPAPPLTSDDCPWVAVFGVSPCFGITNQRTQIRTQHYARQLLRRVACVCLCVYISMDCGFASQFLESCLMNCTSAIKKRLSGADRAWNGYWCVTHNNHEL